MLHRLESSKQPSLQSDDHDSDPADELNKIPAKGQTPFEACCKSEDLKLMRSYISQLKSRQRQVLQLYYFQDMGLREIGERLGVGEARISQIHKQAVLELRRMISAHRRTPAPSASAMVQ
jgi:RNA polymerase sigma factor for flagellar operon FliA